MRQQVDIYFDQQRAVAKLTGLFGLLALALAGIGLYGVTAYNVERRTSEVGIRMALGANRMDVIRLVLRGAFTQVAIGLAIGIPLTVAAGRLISSQLYGITSWDPMSLALAIAALACCAFAASIIPARHASTIEPVHALRIE
jgi:ABC-type antimicrobial peptide transport system permease subunit